MVCFLCSPSETPRKAWLEDSTQRRPTPPPRFRFGRSSFHIRLHSSFLLTGNTRQTRQTSLRHRDVSQLLTLRPTLRHAACPCLQLEVISPCRPTCLSYLRRPLRPTSCAGSGFTSVIREGHGMRPRVRPHSRLRRRLEAADQYIPVWYIKRLSLLGSLEDRTSSGNINDVVVESRSRLVLDLMPDRGRVSTPELNAFRISQVHCVSHMHMLA
ncbi:hypothetical protein BD310DRAFT_424784 [Dichomitus squalens]|uniref:Uncharacterized protein n=1 Tax=Dichomitus squalens TaxID=114155 RepID=A0A4Q9PXA5_9APHY|nr:hypothetical protein BD310DRAFT_424784 [Dichomitus squalens]